MAISDKTFLKIDGGQILLNGAALKLSDHCKRILGRIARDPQAVSAQKLVHEGYAGNHESLKTQITNIRGAFRQLGFQGDPILSVRLHSDRVSLTKPQGYRLNRQLLTEEIDPSDLTLRPGTTRGKVTLKIGKYIYLGEDQLRLTSSAKMILRRLAEENGKFISSQELILQEYAMNTASLATQIDSIRQAFRAAGLTREGLRAQTKKFRLFGSASCQGYALNTDVLTPVFISASRLHALNIA